MARRRMRGRGRGRGRGARVVWDTLFQPQSLLPLLTLDNVNGGRDGAFTSLIRWRGADVTILRTLFQSLVRVSFLDFPVDATSVLEICIGLSPFDLMGDINGTATNTTLAANTGPLTDADNSRWFARCCVQIPIGRAATLAVTETPIIPFVGARAGPHTGALMWIGNTIAANQSITWWCEWDSRTKRKLQGAETEWIQLAVEAAVSVVPAVGDDITVGMDSFRGRVVKTEAGLPELV